MCTLINTYILFSKNCLENISSVKQAWNIFQTFFLDPNPDSRLMTIDQWVSSICQHFYTCVYDIRPVHYTKENNPSSNQLSFFAHTHTMVLYFPNRGFLINNQRNNQPAISWILVSHMIRLGKRQQLTRVDRRLSFDTNRKVPQNFDNENETH